MSLSNHEVRIEENQVREFLRTRPDGRLHHREGQELEFKEQFNLGGLAEYLRDFAAFANNRGGYIVFGVTDSPRTPAGLSAAAVAQFEKIDPATISGHVLTHFSPFIDWGQELITLGGRSFGVLRVLEAQLKPVIAKQDGGKELRNGDVYYRYGGRTQRIQHPELESIIARRIARNNQDWLDLVTKIALAGPANAAVLDTEKGLITKHDSQILVVDEKLAHKLKFIKQGAFSEVEGEKTLKLVGDLHPVDKVEVVQRIRENLTSSYPFSAKELAAAVKAQQPGIGLNRIWEIIKENDLKSNKDYSAYNFRNKRQEDQYRIDSMVASGTPSIYNQKAADFVLRVLKDELSKG